MFQGGPFGSTKILQSKIGILQAVFCLFINATERICKRVFYGFNKLFNLFERQRDTRFSLSNQPHTFAKVWMVRKFWDSLCNVWCRCRSICRVGQKRFIVSLRDNILNCSWFLLCEPTAVEDRIRRWIIYAAKNQFWVTRRRYQVKVKYIRPQVQGFLNVRHLLSVRLSWFCSRLKLLLKTLSRKRCSWSRAFSRLRDELKVYKNCLQT